MPTYHNHSCLYTHMFIVQAVHYDIYSIISHCATVTLELPPKFNLDCTFRSPYRIQGVTSTCTFIVPINTADGEAIVASLQRLLKCRVQHLLIKIINIIFHYPSEYCHSTIRYIAVWCLTELLSQSTYSNFTDLMLHFFLLAIEVGCRNYCPCH